MPSYENLYAFGVFPSAALEAYGGARESSSPPLVETSAHHTEAADLLAQASLHLGAGRQAEARDHLQRGMAVVSFLKRSLLPESSELSSELNRIYAYLLKGLKEAATPEELSERLEVAHDTLRTLEAAWKMRLTN